MQNRRGWLLGIVVFFLLLAAVVWVGKSQSDYQHFVGTWRLIDSTNKEQDTDAVGYLIYTPDGVMSSQIMRRMRTEPQGDILSATLQSIAEALSQNYYAYAGRFEVDDKQKIVTSFLEMHVNPNEVGKQLKRSYRFEKDRLYLTTIGTQAPSVQTWERVKPLQR